METCPQPGETPSIDLARNLAALHQLCVTHIKELQKLSVVQVSDCLTSFKVATPQRGETPSLDLNYPALQEWMWCNCL